MFHPRLLNTRVSSDATNQHRGTSAVGSGGPERYAGIGELLVEGFTFRLLSAGASVRVRTLLQDRGGVVFKNILFKKKNRLHSLLLLVSPSPARVDAEVTPGETRAALHAKRRRRGGEPRSALRRACE